MANANLWRKVVDRLADRFACITLDLPFGSHRVPMRPDADLTPAGCGALVLDVLDALELSDVTLVGNDSGGAYCQIAVSQRPERVTRLVLNSCETPYDEFPPPPFHGLPEAVRDDKVLPTLLHALEDREGRRAEFAYGLLMKHPAEDAASDSYVLPGLHEPGVLHDVRKVMSSAASEPVHAAGERLIAEFDRPVLFAWGLDDQVFPVAHARRYAARLANARVALIEDAYSFTPEDQPEALAGAIAAFCEEGEAG